MTEQEYIEHLKAEGFDKVYVWDAEPGEEDLVHEHPFDTRLIILDKEITIEVGGVKKEYVKGDAIEIPRATPHAVWAGPNGYRYIVAEKH